MSEHGFLLGVLTESLVTDSRPEDLRYASAISVEPLLSLLHKNKIYPASNGETLRVFFDGADYTNGE